jgi:hypothetical protein
MVGELVRSRGTLVDPRLHQRARNFLAKSRCLPPRLWRAGRSAASANRRRAVSPPSRAVLPCWVPTLVARPSTGPYDPDGNRIDHEWASVAVAPSMCG